MAKPKGWLFKPNWYLYHNNEIVACWYCHAKREAKALAKCYVDEAKIRNPQRPLKLRIWKKDFRLVPMYKGVDDA